MGARDRASSISPNRRRKLWDRLAARLFLGCSDTTSAVSAVRRNRRGEDEERILK